MRRRRLFWLTAPTVLYRFFSADGELIYVGITSNPAERFSAHARKKEWWPEVARKTIRWYATGREAAAAEDAVIAARAPRYNKLRHSGLDVPVELAWEPSLAEIVERFAAIRQDAPEDEGDAYGPTTARKPWAIRLAPKRDPLDANEWQAGR